MSRRCKNHWDFFHTFLTALLHNPIPVYCQLIVGLLQPQTLQGLSCACEYVVDFLLAAILSPWLDKQRRLSSSEVLQE